MNWLLFRQEMSNQTHSESEGETLMSYSAIGCSYMQCHSIYRYIIEIQCSKHVGVEEYNQRLVSHTMEECNTKKLTLAGFCTSFNFLLTTQLPGTVHALFGQNDIISSHFLKNHDSV